MAIHIDRKYIHLVSPRLERFTRKNSDLFNFRCPFCGDSQTNKLKCRGYVYRKKDAYLFLCHNCGVSTNLYNLIKHVDPNLVREYSLERYREQNPQPEETNYDQFKAKPTFNNYLHVVEGSSLPNIASLPAEHYARKYVEARQIPEKFHTELYFAEDFKRFVDAIGVEKEGLHEDDPRLVIPFKNEDGEWIAFQGRALGQSKLRYITISLQDTPKFYGLDRMDRSQPVIVVEGPIDSMFLPNAIATADADLTRASLLGLKDPILLYDNENRNKDILKHIDRAIDMGFRVVLMPDTVMEKDINDMILSGATSTGIMKLIEENTYEDLSAKLKLAMWRKV